MPIARFQMPDGRVARFEVPEGTTPEQAQTMMQAAMPEDSHPEPTAPIAIGKDAFPDALRQVLGETDWGTRNIAGMGTSLSNLWEGAKQFFGQEDQNRITSNRIIRDEAPVGAITGDIALTAVPFGLAGNSVKAAGAVGAGYGLTQPIEGAQTALDVAKGKAINTAIGGATGAGGQYVANKATGYVTNKMTQLAAQKAKNAVLDKTLKESADAGYKVPPSMMPDSGVTARILEGVSGKYKTNQLAGIKNQQVTNALAKTAVGLPDNVPLSVPALDSVRNAAYAPYREISSLSKGKGTPAVQPTAGNPVMNIPPTSGSPGVKGFDPKQALEDLKAARADAQAWYTAYNVTPHPDTLAKAKAFNATAEALETDIENYATSLGRSDLVPQLRDARKMIAKTYTVERALKKGSGNVDAKVIGRLFEKQKPLSDGLDKIGKFGATFGDVAGVPKSGNANPFTIIDAGYSMAGGALNPMAYALPLARVAARYGLLSNPAQKAVSAPLYEVSPALRMGGGLLGNSAIGGTVLGLDAFGQ